MRKSWMNVGAALIGLLCCFEAAQACQGPVGNKPGQCAPNFTLQATDSRIFELSKQKGKVVVLNFWATWCEPCIEELPSLEKLYQNLGENVEFVSVSIDRGQPQIDAFFQNNPQAKVTFPILKDFNQNVSAKYDTFKVPETFIIDQEGKIRNKVIGIRDWQDNITVDYIQLLAQ
jgi:peroxiredoxin